MGLKEEAILSYCEKLGVTPNILFTGLFGILMAKYSNAEDSLLSTIYNGRNDSRLENTVCMLVKTLPVYCKFDPKTTVQAYMAELSEQMLSSMANDIFPFSDIFILEIVAFPLSDAWNPETPLPEATTFPWIWPKCLC